MKGAKSISIIMAIAFIALIAQIFLPIPVSARDDDHYYRRKINVDPAHAGFGALATWARDAGEPGQKGDPKQYGLHIQVGVLAPDGPYAGTGNLLTKPIPLADLKKLGFSISGRSGEAGVFTPGDPRHGYCQSGAPRFVVEDDLGNSCLLECQFGTKVQDLDTNWWEISFVPPFSPPAYPSCPGLTGTTVTYIDITFDEMGSVVLDNITATIGSKTTIIGKPDDDDYYH
jgi:hypothetical protein